MFKVNNIDLPIKNNKYQLDLGDSKSDVKIPFLIEYNKDLVLKHINKSCGCTQISKQTNGEIIGTFKPTVAENATNKEQLKTKGVIYQKTMTVYFGESDTPAFVESFTKDGTLIKNADGKAVKALNPLLKSHTINLSTNVKS